jgi:mRNA interferase MazF
MTQRRRGRRVRQGDVLLVNIPVNVPPGHEQDGRRPAVVVAIPSDTGWQRFDVLVVVPLTSQVGAWAGANPTLYPVLQADQAGLEVDSVAMVDHVQAVDAQRVVKVFGTLTPDEYAPIKSGLEVMFGFRGSGTGT